MTNKHALSVTTNRQPWSMNKAHDWLGSPYKDTTMEIVRALSLSVKHVLVNKFGMRSNANS